MKKNYKSLTFIVLTVFLVSIIAAEVSAFAGGDGSPENPYQITNCVQLQEMNNNLTANYILVNDINCSDTVNWNSGEGFVPIGTLSSPFTGTFDGQEHTITGLFINRPSADFIGLFCYTVSSVIKNVGLVNVNITGNNYIGGLVGQNFGTITNSYSTGNISGGYFVGGLVSYNPGTITNSYATANVNGIQYLGGLVGNMGGTITNSYSTGNVNGTQWLGGLLGYNAGTITNSYATGNMYGGYGIGGLVGANVAGTIENSYATGNVNGTQWLGGLLGVFVSGTIENSYAMGNVNDGSGALTVGGLIAYNDETLTTITNSYWDTETSGQLTSDGGTGKTTAEMKTQSTYTNWDFVNIWAIKEGISYPYFLWQREITSGPGTFWIGLKNSDDQGTQFDLRAELYINDRLIAEGRTLCITGVTRNPSYAKEVTVPLDSVADGDYNSGDILSLKVLTRIGTTADGRKCIGPGGSHNNAVGLRLYYDAPNRPSRFGAEIAPDTLKDYFLHSTSSSYYTNDIAPTGTVKYKDSSSINYNNGNPWKQIGTWQMVLE